MLIGRADIIARRANDAGDFIESGPTMVTPRGDHRQRWFIAILLIALAVVPYLQTWSHVFLTYDDPLYVTNNPTVQRGLTMPGLDWAFTTFYASNWHPLTWLSHMADCAMFDLSPRGPHMVNIALHAINTLLVWLVWSRMTGTMWRSAALAAIFAVHPLHVESVAWISERKDLLSTMFGLLAMACYLGFVRNGGASRYGLMLLCFAASLLSKPMLVTLPFVLLLLDYWPLQRMGKSIVWLSTAVAAKTGTVKDGAGKRKSRKQPRKLEDREAVAGATLVVPAGWRRLVVEKAPLLLMSVASSIVTIHAQSSGEAVQTLQDMPMSSRITNAVASYVAYLGKVIWPTNLAVFYPRKKDSPLATVGLSIIVMLLITALTIWQRRRRPWLIVGWLFFLGTLVPVIGLVQVGWQSMADRYMYVPMIGVLMMIVWSIPTLRPASWRLINDAAVCGAIVLLAITTSVQAGYWRNSVALFSRAQSVTADNHVTRCNLGNALMEAQRPDEALEQLLAALRLDERVPLTHYDLGIAYQVRGQLDEALLHYRRAVELSPTYAPAWANLASTLTTMKQYPEAIAAAQRAIDNDPNLAEGHSWMGLALAASGETTKAILELRRAIEIKPRAGATRVNLAVCLAKIDKTDEAMDQARTAVADEPNLAEAHVVLSTILERRGDVPGAISELQKAARIKPGDSNIQQRLQNLLQTPPKGDGGG